MAFLKIQLSSAAANLWIELRPENSATWTRTKNRPINSRSVGDSKPLSVIKLRQAGDECPPPCPPADENGPLEFDPDLSKIVAAWPRLNAKARAALLSFVECLPGCETETPKRKQR